jgi:hypothetical protein
VGDAAPGVVGDGTAESSWLTSSPVTLFMTSGPVINMWLVPSTIKTKSVIAGE